MSEPTQYFRVCTRIALRSANVKKQSNRKIGTGFHPLRK